LKGTIMSASSPSGPSPIIEFSPSGIIRRRLANWQGLRAETVELTNKEPFEYRFRAGDHLLIASERAQRDDGETFVEGLPKSRLRDFTRKLTLVPAGHEFHGWQRPRVLMHVTYFYIDPHGPLSDPEQPLGEIELAPRLFFFDSDLWETAAKLKEQIGNATGLGYAQALSVVLAHELVRQPAPAENYNRGGLASWQQKRVAEYIDEHLAEDIPLATLASIARLSLFHFARAFKQSFGVPPHRYHATRRIARAKSLLAEPAQSVTEIAFGLGFHELSSFTATFRKLAGTTPSQYRRSL
jgi:AraC family transcriptional regulator